MKKTAQTKRHLPGARTCEARQVFDAFRDDPAMRHWLLIQAMGRTVANPCPDHEFLNDQQQASA